MSTHCYWILQIPGTLLGSGDAMINESKPLHKAQWSQVGRTTAVNQRTTEQRAVYYSFSMNKGTEDKAINTSSRSLGKSNCGNSLLVYAAMVSRGILWRKNWCVMHGRRWQESSSVSSRWACTEGLWSHSLSHAEGAKKRRLRDRRGRVVHSNYALFRDCCGLWVVLCWPDSTWWPSHLFPL